MMIKNGLYYFRKAFVFGSRRNSSVWDSSGVREFSLFWGWFDWIFNSVDRQRLKLVGPDCTCAEWLLRNGAWVRFKGHKSLLSDYHALIALEETPELPRLKIEEIYAKDSSVSGTGFAHFRNCNHINKVTFILCSHLSGKALFKLKYISDSLEHLEIKSCFSVDDDGILSLTQLRNLKTLKLSGLASVKKKEECEAVLRRELTQCHIDFQE